MQTKNFLQFSDLIYTSGQPVRHEFEDIQKLGVDTVINLAMPSSETAIVDEGDIVTSLEMFYIHMPIPWEAPRPEHFQFFRNTLSSMEGKRLWVHCALNMRVSAFMYLYARCELNMDEHLAGKNLHAIWQPNEVWKSYIEETLKQA